MNQQEALQLAKSNDTSLEILWEIVETLNLIKVWDITKIKKNEVDKFLDKTLTTEEIEILEAIANNPNTNWELKFKAYQSQQSTVYVKEYKEALQEQKVIEEANAKFFTITNTDELPIIHLKDSFVENPAKLNLAKFEGLQSSSNLSKENLATILDNCRTKIIFDSKEYPTAQEIELLLEEKEINHENCE